jgi:hypothetical protein
MIDKFIALLDRWIAASSGSHRRIEDLEALHRRGLHAISHHPSVDVAPPEYCKAAGLPIGSYWPLVVAAVLDEVSQSQQAHSIETLHALVAAQFLSQQEMDRTVAFAAAFKAQSHSSVQTINFERWQDAA